MNTVPERPSKLLSQLPAAIRPRLTELWSILAAGPAALPAVRQLASQQPEQLLKVWACSEFAAHQCQRHPQQFATLAESGRLTRPSRGGEITTLIKQRLLDANTENRLAEIIFQLRNQEMLRIAWRDLTDQAALEKTLADLSALADGLLIETLSRLYQWMVQAKGQPLDSAGEPIQLTVLAFGKLGGHELNFSSDIDLVFTYAEEGEIQTPKVLSHTQFFQQLATQLMRCLGGHSNGGLVFRVDTRLRPFGHSGQPVISFDAMEHYYTLHGREWERYALIKARPIGADPAGHALLDKLRPFMYRRYLDFGVIESLREMKQLILREGRLNDNGLDIKLGRGGIREIEFITQAQQLIWGGREPDLQTPKLNQAITRLQQANHLPPTVVAELLDSYQFLRRLENRLQMRRDQQTHTIPDDADERALLALSMNYANWGTLSQALEVHLKRTHDHFCELTAFDSGEAQNQATNSHGRAGLEARAPEMLERLTEYGFDDTPRALEVLRGLLSDSHYRFASPDAQRRLDRLMPELLKRVGALQNSQETLTRLVRLLETILRRSAYLSLLIENPQALAQLVKLSASSPWIAHWLTQHPVLLDELIDPRLLQQTTTREALVKAFSGPTEVPTQTDLDEQMTHLRETRHGAVLRVAAAELNGVLTTRQAGESLAEVAEVTLLRALDLSTSHFQKRQQSGIDTSSRPGEILALAYGKLGSRELGYFSDLDLVLLRSNEAPPNNPDGHPHDQARQSVRIAQRAIHILATRTAAGRAYEIDLRLRPNGESGSLVPTIETYSQYQQHSAWTWEHMALVRARPIKLGPGDTLENPLANQFEQLRKSVLCRARETGQLGRDVREMREKMLLASPAHSPELFHTKSDRGGLIDIEFLTQYLVLAHANRQPELATPRHTLDLLTAVTDSGLLTQTQGQLLQHAYKTLLSHERRRALQREKPLVPRAAWAELSMQVRILFDELTRSD